MSLLRKRFPPTRARSLFIEVVHEPVFPIKCASAQRPSGSVFVGSMVTTLSPIPSPFATLARSSGVAVNPHSVGPRLASLQPGHCTEAEPGILFEEEVFPPQEA